MSRRLRSRNKRAAAALFDSEAEESDGEQDSGSATTEANGINLTTENGGDVSGSESDGDDHLEDTANFATAKSDLISTRLDNIPARVYDLESGYAANVFCPPARQLAELPMASQQIPLLKTNDCV